MPRRRNLSTDISDDRELNNLAATDGDFAALLFTWAIPHAQDDRSLPGDPDDLLFLVVPRRRDKTPEDAEAAIRAWVAAKLVDWVWVDGKRRIYYKADSFYRIQDKVPRVRRFYGLPGGSTPVALGSSSPQGAADSPQSAAAAAEEPQSAAAAAESPLARALPAGGPGSDPLLSPPAGEPPVGTAVPPARRQRRPPLPPPTDSEREALGELASVEGYPFDPDADLVMLRVAAADRDLIGVDLAKVARDLRFAHMGNPCKPGRKSNPRLEFRHFCQTEARRLRNGVHQARASPLPTPETLIPLTPEEEAQAERRRARGGRVY